MIIPEYAFPNVQNQAIGILMDEFPDRPHLVCQMSAVNGHESQADGGPLVQVVVLDLRCGGIEALSDFFQKRLEGPALLLEGLGVGYVQFNPQPAAPHRIPPRWKKTAGRGQP